MKKRKVLVTLEIETDLPLDYLYKAFHWEIGMESVANGRIHSSNVRHVHAVAETIFTKMKVTYARKRPPAR